MAIVSTVSVTLSFGTVYLASKGFTPDGRVAVLWLSALIPAMVCPFAMLYVGFHQGLSFTRSGRGIALRAYWPSVMASLASSIASSMPSSEASVGSSMVTVP
jgi:hypothetical protein